MRTIYIVNLHAKNSYSVKIWNRLKKQLGVIESDVYVTHSASELKGIIHKAANISPGEKLFVVGVGGDGTISALINHCIGYENVSVGYFPAGSGNDFAKGYSWPKDVKTGSKIIQLFRENQLNEKLHDSGHYLLNGYRSGYFVNSMGAGFDAKITQRANRSAMKKALNKLSLGKLIYAILVLSEAFTYKTTCFEAVIDGEKKRFNHTWFVTISNQQYYGGGMKIAPSADSADGWLDLTIVHNLSRVKLLLVFLSVFAGKHTSFKEVETFRVKEVQLQSAEPVAVQADGDYIGVIEKNKQLHIEVRHHNWKAAKIKS